MRAAIACGGTGGHVLPGLATARALRSEGHEVTLWMAGRDVERLSAASWDGDAVVVRARGLPRRLSWSALVAAAELAQAAWRCERIMARRRPDVLLAMGGYASVGPVLAARRRGVPLVLHEANAVPGRALAALSRLRCSVAVAFPGAARHWPRRRVVHTGFPLLHDFELRFEDGVLDRDRFTVLVAGGSQGARRLNEVAAAALCRLGAAGRGLQVLHLSGRADEAWVREAYRRAGVRHAVFGHLAEMGKAYGAADLAVCRAGAATCAELCAAGVPALLVPLPSAARDHQTANARALARAGAARLLPQAGLDEASLAEAVISCRDATGTLDAMRAAMENLAVLDADERLARLVIEAARGARRPSGKEEKHADL